MKQIRLALLVLLALGLFSAVAFIAISRVEIRTSRVSAQTPPQGPFNNRANCGAIRGTDYLSDEERTWFLNNCPPQSTQQAPSSTLTAPVYVPQRPVSNVAPNISVPQNPVQVSSLKTSTSSNAADACGGKTQLGPYESFTLQVGCHVKGEVYVWYNNTWAKRFDDDPTTGAVMWCPASACDVKTGNWGAGLSSKDPVVLQKEGCGTGCNYVQLIPVGAYTKGNGPDNPMYEIPQWVPVCYNSPNGWNNSTVMRAEPNLYGWNVQWDVQFDACRQDGYQDYRKLQGN